ncbi:oxidoreductase [Erwinia sp. CPCC 100877]|nr:oxidoreductase [Erwinia sp. CPCC 100877]
MKVVIVGASFAGVSAALAVHQKYPQATVYLLEKQKMIGYLPGGIQLYFKKQVASVEAARFITEQQLEAAGIHLKLQSEVISLDAKQHLLKVKQAAVDYELTYDKLILATGSSQWSQNIAGSYSEKVVKYKDLAGVLQAIETLENSHKVALIGGGQIGAEACDLLMKKGKEVHLFERMDYLLFKYFDREMIQPVQEALSKQGVVFHFEESVESINEQEEGLVIKTKQSALRCDSAVFALNVRPDLAYLSDQVVCHIDGTIKVDAYLETSQTDIFAVGDCIQVPYSLTEETFYIPLVNNAVRTGLLAAENLTEKTLPFVGSIRTLGTKLGEYYLASTGLTEAEAAFYEQPIAASRVVQSSTSFFKGADIHGKIIFEKQSQRILGAQLVSKSNILEKINTLALAVQTKQTLNQLAQKDYLYQPNYTNIFDISNQLGLAGMRSVSNED